MVVMALWILVIVVVPGLEEREDHVPVPVAAVVIVPGAQRLWSGPALGMALTVT